MALTIKTIVNPRLQINLVSTFVFTSSCFISVVVLSKILVLLNYFPIDNRLANNRYAPGTPAGNSLKKLRPV